MADKGYATRALIALAALLGVPIALMVSDSGPPSSVAPGGAPSGSAARVIASAQAALGLDYGSPAKRDAYAEHDYPGTPHDIALQLAKEQSSCLLHARGCLAEAGIDGSLTFRGKRIDALRVPYTDGYIGTVETLLYELARSRGALVIAKPGIRPEIDHGDIVVIGTGGSAPADPADKQAWLDAWGGIAHGAVITGVKGDTFVSIDGGQTDNENSYKPTAIREVTRQLAQRAGGYYWLGGRRINYIIKTGKL